MLGDIIEIIAPDGSAMRVPLAGGDDGVADTVEAMTKIVLNAHEREATKQQAWEITRGLPGVAAKLEALFRWFRERIAFCRDPKTVERIQHPELLLFEIMNTGTACVDCDESATLAAALILGAGLKPVFVTVSETAKGNFTHVYAGVRVPDGRVIAFDPQETAAVGEEAPHKRRKVWDIR